MQLSPPPRVVLLGPQRLQPTLGEVVAGLGVTGPLLTLTAGWQEREGETEELQAALGRPAQDLGLWATVERLHAADPELRGLHRGRQERLLALQSLYRSRLGHAFAAYRGLAGFPHMPGDLVEAQRERAIDALRVLDREHLASVEAEHRRFDEEAGLEGRGALVEARDELRERLASCALLLMAGGHVAALLNKLGLLDLGPSLAALPNLVAWSAGAMVLAERVVLYHDHPPQGRVNAELLGRGLGLLPGLVPLPHASARLALEDPQRVRLFARRFGPDACLVLDPLDRVELRGGRLQQGARLLGSDGRVELRP